MKSSKKPKLFLLAAAVTQVASLLSLIAAICGKKHRKNVLFGLLSLLAFEGASVMCLMVNMKKEMTELTMHGNLEPAAEEATEEAENAEID